MAFISPFTDWGFKTLFGQEANKALLIDFLNDLLQGERVVKDVEYRDKELPREGKEHRGVIYDIYCTSDTGDHFIVEMQNRFQKNFINRAVYYLARAMARQGLKKAGDEASAWTYDDVEAVYGVFLINFKLHGLGGKLRTDVELSDRDTHQLVSDKLRMIFLELPYFNKSEDECETDFERWIFVLQHMEVLERMPFEAQKKIFSHLAELADIEKMDEPDRMYYEQELKNYRDNVERYNSAMWLGREQGIKQGRELGREEGRKEGRKEGREEGREEGRKEGREESAKITAGKLNLLALISKPSPKLLA